MDDFDELFGGIPKPKRSKLEARERAEEKRHLAAKNKPKRPEGMSREAFKLLKSAGHAPQQLAEALQPKPTIYKNKKLKMGLTAPRKYHWVPFDNSARKDGLRLFHWEREDQHFSEYKYAQWNKVLQISKYTDEQYERFFNSDTWTREETDYLFEICQKFDLRWPIVHDRYDCERFRKRSMVDIKERFYNITYALTKRRDPNANILRYDAINEKNRRKQARKQWKRTPEQIEEEKELRKWQLYYEAKAKVRQQKANELQALMDELKKNDPFAERSPVKTVKRSRKTARFTVPKTKEVPSFSRESVLKHFRTPLFKTAGPHLRSEEFIRFRVQNSKREANVGNVLEAAGFNKLCWPPSTEEIVAAVNDFKKDCVILQDLKEALQAAEYELNVLKRKHPEKMLEIQPEFKQINRPLDTTECGGMGQPATSRRFSCLIATKT